MYAVSSSFLTALKSGSMVSSVLVTASNGVTLFVEDGSVSMDSRRNITRTCSLGLTATPTLSALDIYDLMMTPNIEITVQRGLIINGVVEYVSLGVFSTDNAEVDRSVTGVVQWSGSDRSKKISRARFIDPYQITAGTSLADAVTTLLRSRWTPTPVSFGNLIDTIQTNITFEAGSNSDPWDCARKLMADYGYDLSFDGVGVARAVPIPDPAVAGPVFDFGSGDTNLITGALLRGSMEQIYNGVIATGEGSDVAAPVRAESWDTNPLSPTYYQGGFGKVPMFYSSPLITTTAMAQIAATTLLSKLKGKSEQFSWPAIVNPALEPLDVITLNIHGTPQNCVIDSLTIPLKATDAMSAVARGTGI